ncbi:glycosyltransferase family 2 protein [Geobacter sp. FeAm09]|uniref:glycosyltransferase family 2 protein n=1 Tax=Geobacter sp. FeAm09 TaxID=2597769 RepID=UPI00197AF12D|nr:glycosyltransferase family 2 protein [Geobacter sp. FeAm09]
MVSIVMPSYQQVAYLEEAVRSVLDQEGVTVELLVMDPGSSDGSRELLLELHKEYGECLVLHFAPDRGQSDAVNRGMALARGRVLGWLNSDDRLRPGALAKVAPLLARDEPAWLYSKASLIDAQGAPVMSFIAHYKNWRGRRFSRLKLLTENFIPQQGLFWNRALWDMAGGLDIDLHLDMDYDQWLRFARISDPIVLHEELADFRIHGAAKGSRQTGEQLDAAYATACRHVGPLGIPGRLMLPVHRLLSLRTRMAYRWLKPREKM